MAGLISLHLPLTIIFMLFNPIESPTGLCEMSGCRYFFNPELADKIKNIKENGKYDFDHCFCDILKFHMTRLRNDTLCAVVGTPTVKGKAWWTSTVAMDLSKKE